MKLTSADFRDGDYLAQVHCLSAKYGFGCDGGNRSPHLRWHEAPADTKSFVVTCYDPDAPTGSGFWHWIVVNIPATVTELLQDAGRSAALPTGAAEVRTDFGEPGYGGPCPPPGAHPHRYLFSVFALSVESIPVSTRTSAAVVGFMSNHNMLAKASLMGLFKR